jgi:threonine/homoserine/homoserine lactone efflux protein
MDLQAIITLSLAILILAWKPGAGFFLNVSIALRQGFWASFIFVFGAAIGDGIYFLVAYLGVINSFAHFDFLIILVKSLGATYLIWYGIKGLRDGVIAKQTKNLPTKKSALEDFTTGIVFTLGNPITIIFFMALLPTIINLAAFETKDLGIALFIVIFWGTIAYSTVGATAAFLGKNIFKHERAMEILNIVTSSAIIAIGLLIGLSAFPLIDFQSLFF